MPDEQKKIIVDDDWKAEAKREKERLAKEPEHTGALPAPSFAELVNIIVMQAMAGLGLLPGPGGERFAPNLEVAKHFIDMLQVLDDKTRNNLTPEEKSLLDQVLYEARMSFVQVAGGGAAPGKVPPPPAG
ncbi:MAG TPA: DUF1844 domain-containing protein [Phycisphaerae bacterium]|jgi:hypothetical protein|nr:DUF1844 domain-containing protein [Phycisphaerae bacterium]HPM22798.1 DUF1844 domain-containing protein [Phycisphaerae bacterium]